MSTSLAEQLQRLAVPQTSVLKQDKKKPSLLFDPKQAAEISREAFYQIGLDGFEDLKEKNPLFARFSNTLFHITSKGFERSVQDVSANEKLDKQIKKFFLILSPYFLLESAHKALEWLINRYGVHEYNRRDFLMLILPYHETNIFVRALQLIRIKDAGDHFIWLRSLQKTGVHLTKNALYNHASSNPLFLKAIGEFVMEAIKEHDQPHVLTTLFNFYSTTFTGALEFSSNINESHVSHMLNVLLKGQKSIIPDFCAGSYIITAKLLSKSEFSDKILNKFVNYLSRVPVNSLKMEAILLLIVLYQTQKHFTEIPDLAIKNLASKVWIPKLLQQLTCTKSFIDPFFEPLCRGLIRCGLLETETNEIQNFTINLINEIKLEDSFVPKLIGMLLDGYNPKSKQFNEDAYQWLRKIMSVIETQYPAAFDKEANVIMKVEAGEKLTKRQKSFRKLLMNSSGVYGNDSMLDRLYHPVPDIRKASVKHCIKVYGGLKEREQDFLKNAILDRLNDDDSTVVFEILSQSSKLLPEIIDKDALKKLLITLLRKSQNDDQHWRKVANPAAKILCQISDGSDVTLFITLFPFLLPLKESEMKIAKLIINSDRFNTCKYFKLIDLEAARRTTTATALFTSVIDGLKLSESNFTELIDAIKNISFQNDDILSKYASMLLLCTSLPEKSTPEIGASVFSIIQSCIGRAKLKVMKNEVTPKNYLLFARQNKFPLQGVLNCIDLLIDKVEFPPYSFRTCDLSRTGGVNKFYVGLLDMLLTGCYSAKGDVSAFYARTLQKYLDRLCPQPQLKIDLFLNIGIPNNNRDISASLRLRCIRTVCALLSKNPVYKSPFDNVKYITAHLLVGLLNEHREIREAILSCIDLVSKNLPSEEESNRGIFLRSILNYKGEIVLDGEQISSVIGRVYEESANSKAFNGIIHEMSSLVTNRNDPMYLRGGVANLLVAVDDIDVHDEISELNVEILQGHKDFKGEIDELLSKVLCNTLNKLNGDNASKIKLSSNICRALIMAIKNDTATVQVLDVFKTLSELSIGHIDRCIFENFQNDVKLAVLDAVVEVATTTSNPDVTIAAGKVFKHMDLDTNFTLAQMTEMLEVQSPRTDVSKRRRRVSVVPTAEILETMQWRKGITILEFLQDKKKMRNADLLISLLFRILKKCLDFDEQSNVEYPKQLILSTLLNCCEKIEDANIPENVLNVEVVVQCIRASQNPQTHHHALLVLAYTANLIPKQVLHHIMAIFTFMGSSVLRHDDAYSFQIINRIVNTIIPILIEDNTRSKIVSVFRVFVDALLDVPAHRRMTLYVNLLEKIDADNNLYIFLLLVLEAHILHASVEKHKSTDATAKDAKGLAAPKRLDIAAEIARRFPPDVVIGNCIKLITYLQGLPEEKDDIKNRADLPFDISHHTSKQYRHFKYVILTFTAGLLSSKEFVGTIASLDDEKQEKLEPLYKNMIISVITYIQATAKIADKNRNTSQSQYWKVILHHNYDVLDSINALLTPQMFLLVIRGLTTHNLNPIRRRSLELLNSKLQHDSSYFSECTVEEMYAMVPALLNIIKQDVSDENELIIQTAFLSLKLFVKHLAKDNPEKFVQVMDFVTNLIECGRVRGNILASTLLCLAELCTHLRAHSISNLSKFMPAVVKVMKISRNQEYPDLLLLSAITTILKIVECLPLFLSSYLDRILYELCRMIAKWQDSDDSKLKPVVVRLLSIKRKIGELIPCRVLIPAIEKTYNQLIEKQSYIGVAALMDVLSEKISNVPGAEVQSNLSDLSAFFLNALQFRTEQLTPLSESNEIEQHIISALVVFTLKLSESTFRPLYYKIYDWAIRNDSKNDRIITFYSLSSSIAGNLKSLFVSFAGHFLNNAATVLDACNVIKQSEMYFPEKQKTVMLLELVLKTLHSIFLHDTQKFINKERFDVLLQPIVDQLENVLDGEEAFILRAENLLIPCVVQFAVATGDDALWKQLNYQILLKMRHSSSAIRMTSLKCVLQLASKLGEDFLPLLPETIPFLAELLEDEDENVEKTCKRTVQEMEKVLGEPLQKYF